MKYQRLIVVVSPKKATTIEISKLQAAVLSSETTNISVGIQNEQELLLKKLFRNKTIAFIDCKGFLDGSNRNIIDHKLVIINDEFISPKALKQRLV